MAHVGGFLFGAAIALIVRFGRGTRSRITPTDDYWDPTGGVGHGPYRHLFDERRSDLP